MQIFFSENAIIFSETKYYTVYSSEDTQKVQNMLWHGFQ